MHLMTDIKFDHIGLAETSTHWNYLQDEDKIPQRFIGYFTRQKLYWIIACNEHDPLLGLFQYGGTSSIFTSNLTGINTTP